MIVSDTGPLNYLIQISADPILPTMFDSVLIPTTVLRELSHPDAPDKVRRWVAELPPWVSVIEPEIDLSEKPGLHAGEIAAIALARWRRTGLLIDDRRAKSFAEKQGILATGTLAVLFEASRRELLEFEPMLDRLLATTFRASASLVTRYRELSCGERLRAT